MKKQFRLICVAGCVYLLLIVLLTLSERSAGGPIHTLGDSFWYSLVTMTTVGYGDLYPVTVGG